MKIVFNKENNNDHLTLLKALIAQADEIILCAGWVKLAGLKRLTPALKAAQERNSKIQIISNQKHTPSQCIKYLAKLKIAHIPISQSDTRYFHTKFYFFASGNTYHAVIGSANLTEKALTENEELSVVISGEKGDSNFLMIQPYLKRIREEYITPHTQNQ